MNNYEMINNAFASLSETNNPADGFVQWAFSFKDELRRELVAENFSKYNYDIAYMAVDLAPIAFGPQSFDDKVEEVGQVAPRWLAEKSQEMLDFLENL